MRHSLTKFDILSLVARIHPCTACSTPLEREEGVELWGNRYCAACFITQAGEFHRQLTPAQLVALRQFGRELAGILPTELVRMVLIGFHQRSTGIKTQPPEEELERGIGEFQRLTYFAMSRKVMNLLRTWKDLFDDFVDGQEREIRNTVKRLTDLDADKGPDQNDRE